MKISFRPKLWIIDLLVCQTCLYSLVISQSETLAPPTMMMLFSPEAKCEHLHLHFFRISNQRVGAYMVWWALAHKVVSQPSDIGSEQPRIRSRTVWLSNWRIFELPFVWYVECFCESRYEMRKKEGVRLFVACLPEGCKRITADPLGPFTVRRCCRLTPASCRELFKSSALASSPTFKRRSTKSDTA